MSNVTNKQVKKILQKYFFECNSSEIRNKIKTEIMHISDITKVIMNDSHEKLSGSYWYGDKEIRFEVVYEQINFDII